MLNPVSAQGRRIVNDGSHVYLNAITDIWKFDKIAFFSKITVVEHVVVRTFVFIFHVVIPMNIR